MKNTASNQARCAGYRFLAVLIATIGSNTSIGLATAGEIVSVKRSGVFNIDLEVKYMDRNGDVARCTLTRNEKFLHENCHELGIDLFSHESLSDQEKQLFDFNTINKKPLKL